MKPTSLSTTAQDNCALKKRMSASCQSTVKRVLSRATYAQIFRLIRGLTMSSYSRTYIELSYFFVL